MNISGTNPIDGGGKIPPQPIDPKDPKGGGNNNSKVVPTTSQDMAAILAQTGQALYVPAQIIPGDENKDVSHDSSNKYKPDAKNNNTKTVVIDTHMPRTTGQFNTLLNQFNIWMNEQQHANNLPSLQEQMPRQGSEIIDDDYLSDQPVTFTQTNGVKGEVKSTDHVSDFIDNFVFSDMTGTKGLVAWALMMNYLKSAIWASALTSTDVEALMEQFKAMIEQLKASADAKKLLSEKQGAQMEYQAGILATKGRDALQLKMCGIYTQMAGVGVDMIGTGIREAKSAYAKRKLENEKASGAIAGNAQLNKTTAEHVIFARAGEDGVITWKDSRGNKIEIKHPNAELKKAMEAAQFNDNYMITLNIKSEAKDKTGKELSTKIEIKASTLKKMMEEREKLNDSMSGAEGFELSTMEKAADEHSKQIFEALVPESDRQQWLTAFTIKEEKNGTFRSREASYDYKKIVDGLLVNSNYKEEFAKSNNSINREAEIRIEINKTMMAEFNQFMAAPNRDNAEILGRKIYERHLYGDKLNSESDQMVLAMLKNSYGVDFRKPVIGTLDEAEKQAIINETNNQIDGLAHISLQQRQVIKEQEIEAKTKIALLLKYSDEQLLNHRLNKEHLREMMNEGYMQRNAAAQRQKLDHHLESYGPDFVTEDLFPEEMDEITSKIDLQYPPGAFNPLPGEIRTQIVDLEVRMKQILNIPNITTRTGITRGSLEKMVNQSSRLQNVNNYLEECWVARFTNNLMDKAGIAVNAERYYNAHLGPEGQATKDLKGAVSTAKSLERSIVEMQELEPTRKKIHTELIAAINHRESKKIRVLNRVIELLGKYIETQGDKMALVRDILTKYSESYQTMLRGQNDSATAVLDGMLQLMQKILDALVQLQQSLRQTATQATGSMATALY
jgi:hypothetical protein